ncbi:hypothetical protein HBB16_18760 [Pseudonocardia sp. MCCB 268]|nr:hypothetical protein [Pseudonocardia cytotoxica]
MIRPARPNRRCRRCGVGVEVRPLEHFFVSGSTNAPARSRLGDRDLAEAARRIVAATTAPNGAGSSSTLTGTYSPKASPAADPPPAPTQERPQPHPTASTSDRRPAGASSRSTSRKPRQ